jgi:hypothetical protein
MGLVIMAAPASVRHWAAFGKWLPKACKDKWNLIW